MNEHFQAGHRLFFTHDPDYAVSSIIKNNGRFNTTEDILEFKRVYGYGQGLTKALEIINEMSQKYQKGEIDDD